MNLHDDDPTIPGEEDHTQELPGEDESFEGDGRIGPYKLLRTLGEGGMGVVYLAEQTEPVRRRVALKVIKVGLDTKQFVARFEAERQALAVMNHPNIAKVLDAGATDTGRPYFVMELARGERITTYCDRYKLSTRDRLRLFIPVCEAIQHAHLKGVIHRDLKPSNVIVTIEDGRPIPKVIDFGLAKAVDHRLTEQSLVTGAGVLLGTPAYMSPEQVEATELDVDTRTDVYSLGITLYELLAGTVPRSPTGIGLLAFSAQLVDDKPPPTPSTRFDSLGDDRRQVAQSRGADPGALKKQLKGDLERIVMKAIETDRTRRYETSNGLALDIQRFLDDKPVLARAPTAAYRLRKFVRRYRLAVAAGTLGFVALVAGTTLATVGLVRARRAETVAAREAEAAREVSDFLVGLFEVSDPNKRGAEEITAREILDRGADQVTRELDDQPLARARFMGAIGRVFLALALYDRAAPLLEQSLALRKAGLDPSHPDVAKSLDYLADLYLRRGRYDDAVPLYEEAIAIWREAGPRYRGSFGNSLHGLGSLYRFQGKLDKAEEYLGQALAMREEVYGPDHINLAMTISSLATVYRKQGDFEGAELLYRRALEIREAADGPDHPGVARTLNSLAVLHIQQEEFDEAEALLQRSTEIKVRRLGPEHPDVANNLDNLAILYARQQKWSEAEATFKRALSIRESSLGVEHPEVAQSLNNLGVLYNKLERPAEAEEYFRRSLVVAERSLDPGHPKLDETRRNLADVLRKQGREAEAEQLLSEESGG